MGLALVVSLTVTGCTKPELKPIEITPSITGYSLEEYIHHSKVEAMNLIKTQVVLEEDLPDDLRVKVKALEKILIALLRNMDNMVRVPDQGLVYATKEQMAEFRSLHAVMDELLEDVKQQYDDYHADKPKERSA